MIKIKIYWILNTAYYVSNRVSNQKHVSVLDTVIYSIQYKYHIIINIYCKPQKVEKQLFNVVCILFQEIRNTYRNR